MYNSFNCEICGINKLVGVHAVCSRQKQLTIKKKKAQKNKLTEKRINYLVNLVERKDV